MENSTQKQKTIMLSRNVISSGLFSFRLSVIVYLKQINK